MIVVDTSALLAIAFAETESEAFLDRILADPDPRMHQVNYFESFLGIVHRKGERYVSQFDQLVEGMRIQRVGYGPRIMEHTRSAFLQFGKGRHRAGLNFGDCFAYATAKHLESPLLFKGDDFAATDLARAL